MTVTPEVYSPLVAVRSPGAGNVVYVSWYIKSVGAYDDVFSWLWSMGVMDFTDLAFVGRKLHVHALFQEE